METKGCACSEDTYSQRFSSARTNDDTMNALDRMREDIQTISMSDTFINHEMTKARVVCSPPPITPPCRLEDVPPDPYMVTMNMRALSTAERELQKELDDLRPFAPTVGKRFEQDVQIMDRQLDQLDTEVKKLVDLTDLTMKRGYDRRAIRTETELINHLTRNIEMTRIQMINDVPREK